MIAPNSLYPSPNQDAEDLYRQHRQMLAARQSWLDIWDMMCNHPCFVAIVDRCVNRALRRTLAPRQWADDIRQDALIRIGGQLQQSPDLNFDASRGNYAGWLDRCIYFACLKALIQFRESRRSRRDIRESDRVLDPADIEHLMIDYCEAVDRLPASERELFLQFSNGTPLDQIAKLHDCSRRTVYRRVRRAVDFLKRHLSQ